MKPTSAASARPEAGQAADLAVQRQAMVRLRVSGADGRAHWLELQATSTAAAIQTAAARGLRVLEVGNSPGVQHAAGPRQRFPLLLFCQELLALLQAGLNLTEALDTLLAKERQPAARQVLQGVVRALSEGRNFSDVLAAQAQHFPEVFVATVRASERTGDLAQALSRYIAYQLQFDQIRKKLVSVSIYPLMLVLVGAAVSLFLLGYVVPRFSLAYESSGRPLPWLTEMLLTLGRFVAAHGWALAAAAAGGMAVVGTALAKEGVRAWLLDRVLRMPGLAGRAAEFRLARFYRAVSLLLAAGIPLPRAMGMVTGLLGTDQQRRLAQARLAVEQGRSLSQALVAAGLAGAVAESLIKVGERSGQLADMLERTARFHDDDFARWVDWASRLLEPVLMAVIGIVIGAVVVLMYMPIFDLAGGLQ